VTLLGLAGAQAAAWCFDRCILVFPALFAVGMALVDTTDGVLMLGAYQWAFVKPIRSLYYNMTITAVSALVAIIIGGIETIALIAHQLELTGGGWRIASSLAGHYSIRSALQSIAVVCGGMDCFLFHLPLEAIRRDRSRQ